MPHTLADIAALLGCPAPPRDAVVITGVATMAEAGPTELAALGSAKFLRSLSQTRAAAVLVSRDLSVPTDGVPLLVVDDADLAMARVLELFAPPVRRPGPGVDPSAHVAEGAVVAADAGIGPCVFVGAGARVGAGAVLHHGVYIGDDVTIGPGCELFPGVVVRERVTIGARVIIHAGSVLGSDGFGYRWDGSRHVKIPQIGSVVIEDDVEIGSCVCIDRAKVGVTRVGRGTKIDNLVQIAHNVQIGPHCIIVAECGIAGSTTLGAGVVLAGASAVRDHLNIGAGAIVSAVSGVSDDVEPGGHVAGVPAVPRVQWLREQASLRRLPELIAQVRKLEKEIEELKKKKT